MELEADVELGYIPVYYSGGALCILCFNAASWVPEKIQTHIAEKLSPPLISSLSSH